MPGFAELEDKGQILELLRKGVSYGEIRKLHKVGMRTLQRYAMNIAKERQGGAQDPSVVQPPGGSEAAPRPGANGNGQAPAAPQGSTELPPAAPASAPRGKPRAAAPKMNEGGKLATVLAQSPAPIIFVLNQHRIDLDPECILECFQFFTDAKVHHDLKEESFSEFLRDGVGLLSTIISVTPVIDNGKVRMEVSDGRSIGHSQEEVGVG